MKSNHKTKIARARKYLSKEKVSRITGNGIQFCELSLKRGSESQFDGFSWNSHASQPWCELFGGLSRYRPSTATPSHQKKYKIQFYCLSGVFQFVNQTDHGPRKVNKIPKYSRKSISLHSTTIQDHNKHGNYHFHGLIPKSLISSRCSGCFLNQSLSQARCHRPSPLRHNWHEIKPICKRDLTQHNQNTIKLAICREIHAIRPWSEHNS